MTIQLTYRRTSRLSMRIVKNGDVHVSAPIGMSKKEVEEFINQHQEWIVEARKKTAERQNQRADFYSQLPLTTKAQKVEATERLRAMVEPMLERHAKVMGVSPSATDAEVKAAYRKQALQNHPDRVASLGEDIRKAAEKKFQEINAAKETIWKARGLS